jgi:hypothetical protein
MFRKRKVKKKKHLLLQALVRKFSNAAADLERLKKTTKELKVNSVRQLL